MLRFILITTYYDSLAFYPLSVSSTCIRLGIIFVWQISDHISWKMDQVEKLFTKADLEMSRIPHVHRYVT